MQPTVDDSIEFNIDICYGCKFWRYFETERRERCCIKGCHCNSKYRPYVFPDNKLQEVKDERKHM